MDSGSAEDVYVPVKRFSGVVKKGAWASCYSARSSGGEDFEMIFKSIPFYIFLYHRLQKDTSVSISFARRHYRVLSRSLFRRR